MRLLFVIPTSPLPVFSGGSQRIVQVLKRLAARHEVVVAAFWRGDAQRAGLAQLAEDMDIEVIPVAFKRLRPNRNFPSTVLRRTRARFGHLPADIAIWEQAGMHEAISRIMAARPPDLIQVEYPYLAPYALAYPHLPKTLAIYEVPSVSLHDRARLAETGRQRRQFTRQAEAWARYESATCPRFDLTITVSDEDAAVIGQQSPTARVAVWPNGVDTVALQPGPMREQAHHLLFVGSPNHAPNIDGACWLLRDIWPRLLSLRPDLRLTLANMDTPGVRTCIQPGVEITGRLPDLTPMYRRADIALAPLRSGAGTRLKVLEAFALGVPVISTSIGRQGLHVTPGVHLLSADSADDFVAAVLRLLDSVNERRQLVASARTLVENEYDWDRIVDMHEQDFAEIVRRKQA